MNGNINLGYRSIELAYNMWSVLRWHGWWGNLGFGRWAREWQRDTTIPVQATTIAQIIKSDLAAVLSIGIKKPRNPNPNQNQVFIGIRLEMYFQELK